MRTLLISVVCLGIFLLPVSGQLANEGAQADPETKEKKDPRRSNGDWAEKSMIRLNDSVSAVAVSPDEKTIAAGSSGTQEPTVTVFEAENEGKTQDIHVPGRTRAMKFTPDGGVLAIGTTGKVIFWNLAQKKAVREFDSFSDMVMSLDISLDGKKLAACDLDTAAVWDIESGKRLFEHRRPGRIFQSLALSPDGSMLALASSHITSTTDPGEILVWKIGDRAPVRTFTANGMGEVSAVAISPDGTKMAAAATANQKLGPPKGGIFLWDIPKGKVTVLSPQHNNSVRTVAFSSKEKWLASAGLDGTIFFWDSGKAKLVATQSIAVGTINALRFSPSDRYLVVGRVDGRVQVLCKR